MKFTIPGIPIAQCRPKFRRRETYVQTYDPQQKIKEDIRNQIFSVIHSRIHDRDQDFIKEFSKISSIDAYSLHIEFHMPFLSTKKISPWLIDHHIYKPDIDNLCKHVLDVLSGLIFSDDQQIVELHLFKKFSKNPRTEITIMPKKKIEVRDKVKQILDIFDPKSVEEFYEDVETLQMLLQGVNLKNMELVKPEWLASAACFLSTFSHRYCDRLNKVKKLGDISKEVDDYETEKEKLNNNDTSTRRIHTDSL